MIAAPPLLTLARKKAYASRCVALVSDESRLPAACYGDTPVDGALPARKRICHASARGIAAPATPRSPVVCADALNTYVIRDRLRCSDMGLQLLLAIPTSAVRKLLLHDDAVYYLDVAGRLWRDHQLLSEGVCDFTERYLLTRAGVALQLQQHNVALPCPWPLRQLGEQAFLTTDHQVVTAHGAPIATGVLALHEKGDELVAVSPLQRLRYFRRHHECTPGELAALLDYPAAKAVVHHRSLLVLTPDGLLYAAGRNAFFEAGVNQAELPVPHRVALPRRACDFDFDNGSGWAVLDDHSVWVWGDNEGGSRYLQWPDEDWLTPRQLPL